MTKRTTDTLTGKVLAVFRSNRKGLSLPQLESKIAQRFGNADRQTLSSRVSALYNNYQLEKGGTVVNPETGRSTQVYFIG